MTGSAAPPDCREVTIGDPGLDASLYVPGGAKGLVIFAHASGGERTSPHNDQLAQCLHRACLATLLLDLLTIEEAAEQRNVFDIALLASRLRSTVDWAQQEPATAHLAPAYLGASTGAAAAIRAAVGDSRIAAIVSRGGRPDLAGIPTLARIRAPTLLIVGSLDGVVIDLNRAAAHALICEHRLAIVPGAGHLFDEPGTLDRMADLAREWFLSQLKGPA